MRDSIPLTFADSFSQENDELRTEATQLSQVRMLSPLTALSPLLNTSQQNTQLKKELEEALRASEKGKKELNEAVQASKTAEGLLQRLSEDANCTICQEVMWKPVMCVRFLSDIGH